MFPLIWQGVSKTDLQFSVGRVNSTPSDRLYRVSQTEVFNNKTKINFQKHIPEVIYLKSIYTLSLLINAVS